MSSYSKLAIIAGNGVLPDLLIDACKQQARDVVVLSLNPHLQGSHQITLGKVQALLNILHEEKVEDIVFAGGLTRPKLWQLRLDWQGIKLLFTLGRSFFAGDNQLLTSVIQFFEQKSFRVIGAQDLLPELVAPAGSITEHTPDDYAMRDINYGIEQAHILGKQDKGQAVIIRHQSVLDYENQSGTDAMIKRIAAPNTPTGVLVKAKKPQQDTRVDLPSIGLDTVEHAHKAGLVGISIEAGNALLLEREAMIERANALGLFIYGFESNAA
jgi:DUF1009 family protein